MKEKKVEKEIKELINEFYGLEFIKEDVQIRYANLKSCREDIIRSLVITLHLSIEEMIENLLWKAIERRIRGKNTRKEFNQFLHKELKFLQKLQLARLLGLINKATSEKLKKLNTIRNKCAHTWILNIKTWKKEKKKRRKRPFIEYHNKNLLNQKVFLEKFLPEYNKIYLKLFERAF